MGLVSLLTFVGTLIAVPFLVVRIPVDYFVRRKRHRLWRERHPVIRLSLLIGKNILGIFFILAGAVMLFIPGQGVLTILIGIMLTDFPGKFRIERWIIQRRAVQRTVNWLRDRTDRPPLLIPKDQHIGGTAPHGR
jgi:hypothetical protein